jgi:hypothetical protein
MPKTTSVLEKQPFESVRLACSPSPTPVDGSKSPTTAARLRCGRRTATISCINQAIRLWRWPTRRKGTGSWRRSQASGWQARRFPRGIRHNMGSGAGWQTCGSPDAGGNARSAQAGSRGCNIAEHLRRATAARATEQVSYACAHYMSSPFLSSMRTGSRPARLLPDSASYDRLPETSPPSVRSWSTTRDDENRGSRRLLGQLLYRRLAVGSPRRGNLE